VAIAIADRFMKIQFRNPDYMFDVGLAGLLDVYEATREQRYLDFYLAKVAPAKSAFDWRLYELTQDRRWLEGVEERAEKFLADPRRDREGALLDPRGRYTVDVFSGQFTFPIIYGHLLRDHRFFDEAAKLLEINHGYMEDPQTGVWFSRWGAALHQDRVNPGLWSRGNGWLVAAWGRVMHLWDASHRAYAPTLAYWQRYCRSITALQRPSGLFRQLLNREGSFEEASGSGLFCTGFSRGVIHGTLPDEFGATASRIFSGLTGIVDVSGNIHNVSTYAGGYNFERQYESCARFNEPHGDGTVMSGCVALHLLRKTKPAVAQPRATEKPVIVTTAAPGVLTTEPPVSRSADEIAPPVLRRALALTEIPEHDPWGGAVLGLLHWHDYANQEECLSHAQSLFERSRQKLSASINWTLTAEIASGLEKHDHVDDLLRFVDDALKQKPRDRCGLFLDSYGGYSVEHLYEWLPLLAHAGALSGESRYFDEACAQLLGHQRWLEDPLTCFWHSAYGRGAHPRRVTPGLWALGNAYALAAMVRLLEHLPRSHDRYADVVCSLRRLVDKLHEYLPVGDGWRQILDNLRSFPCNAASPLITWACGKAILNGWVRPEYGAIVSGGVYHIGVRTDAEGHFGFSSLPRGGLDTIAAYEQHRLTNDPSALGFILSGLAYGAKYANARLNPDQDGTLGAR
jgi:rhamnogalacturonyl hydrolase YesR